MEKSESENQDMGKKWGTQYTSPSDAALAQERADKRATDEAAAIPSGWRGWQPSRMILLLTFVGAIVLTLLVGFQWAGWQTATAAEKMAETAADDAVVDKLAGICVAQFNMDPEHDTKLVTLKEGTSYVRAGYITEQGWATMPGDEEPVRNVANACGRLIMDMEP